MAIARRIKPILWYDEPSNQCMTWEFTYQGSGYYSIKNAGTGKMLEFCDFF